MPTGGGSGGGAATPLLWYGFAATGVAYSLAGINQVAVTGFALPFPLTFSKIASFVFTADAVNNYDFGIYTKAGVLVANIGAQHLPSTGMQTFATVQGVQTIPPGLYMTAFVGSATTAQLTQASSGTCWCINTNAGTGVAGTLPATVTPQAVTANLVQVVINLL